MPVNPGAGSKNNLAASAGVKTVPAFKSANPPTQVVPAGVDGQDILKTPCAAGGIVLIV